MMGRALRISYPQTDATMGSNRFKEINPITIMKTVPRHFASMLVVELVHADLVYWKTRDGIGAAPDL
jgi:hypothetical protein